MRRRRTLPILPAALLLGTALAVAGPASLAADDAAPPAVTLELIMSDPDWIGNPPEDPYWSDDGGAVYFEQERQGSEIRDLHRVAAAGGEAVKVPLEELGEAGAPGGEVSRDRRLHTWAADGDVFVRDLGSGELRQLTRTADDESDPHFLIGDRRIAFRRGDSIFVRDLDTGLEYQPAELRLEDDPAEEEDPEGYLASQQRRLFDFLREEREEEEAQREHRRAIQRADPTRTPPPWYLGEGLELRHASLAPDGKWMVVVVTDAERDEGRKDQMPVWVTESGYVENKEVRPKVGTGDGTGDRLWILDLESHEKHEVDLSVLPGITDDPLAELRRAAAERAAAEKEEKGEEKEEEKEQDKEEDDGNDDGEPEPRAVRFQPPPAWSFDGEYVAVQAHSVDNKDRWIAVLHRGDPELRPLHHLHDEGWINWYFNDYGWLRDGRTLYYLSEESGYSQLYVHPVAGGERRRLTQEGAVVSEPELGPDGDSFYYVANPDHPGVYEVFRTAVDGGDVEQLTDLGGRNESKRLSLDGEHLLFLHSETTAPPELYVQAAEPGAPARRLTHTASDEFTAIDWVQPEIVPVPSSHHDRPIYSRYYAPGGDPTQPEGERPAVVFVHGAGYLQNAHAGWSGYFRELLFHTLLVERGYRVLDMDYRGSAGYGADWRTAIYRRMGDPELEDLADGVAWLASEHGVDPERVGVYGGSYGGFLTLMALFTEPDLFAAGAALRPVTDWAHYNHPYTANILNTPDVDPEAYERSSPIEFAAGLEAPLLMCAPMQDDNVLFLDTVRLVQRLIELEKQHWEVAIYPVEPHGFRKPSSWLDEYRRIYQLFERHLW